MASARTATALGFAIILTVAAAGCTGRPANPPPADGATTPVLATDEMPHRSDAEMWSQTCSHCHNPRKADYYKPGQWKLVMQQMRVRGYLTGEEQRRITTFLTDASR